MNKLLVAMIVGAFAVAAAAQTNPLTNPSEKSKEKQKDVQATTSANAPSSVDVQNVNKQQQQNVKASKETTKMTTQEKKAFAKDVNKSGVNPNNDAGQAATAAQQQMNVKESKATPKQNTEIKTKEGQKQLSKELQQKASP